MKLKDLHELNVKRSRELNSVNESYYRKISGYIRTSGVGEIEAEELLFEVLEHTLLAQKENKTAIEVFGKDIEAYSKELINYLPKKTILQKIKYHMTAIFVFFFLSCLVGLLDKYYGFNSLNGYEYITTSILYLNFALVTKLIKKSAFKKSFKKIKKLFININLILISIEMVGIGFLINNHEFLKITLNNPFKIGIFVFMLLIIRQKTKEVKIWRLFKL